MRRFRAFVSVLDIAIACVLVTSSFASARPVARPLTVSITSLPDAQANVAYSVALTATGGTLPYTWGVAAGSVPPGLVLSSLGVLSGRPGTAGKTSISLRVTDALGAVASATLSLNVLSPPPTPPPPQRLAVIDGLGTLAVASSGQQTTLSIHSPDGYPFSAVALTPDGHGFFAVTTSGRAVAEGDVVSLGQIGRHLRQPIVGIALDPIGSGYWLVTSSGHVYGFGDAHSYGSVPNSAYDRVIGIAADAAGSGYWIALSTGQVYAFGRAPSMGEVRRSRLGADRIVAIAAPTASIGYELVSARGRLFSFGSPRRAHLPTSVLLPTAIAGLASVRGSSGYFIVAAAGTIASVGSAQVVAPVVGLSAVRAASAST